MNFPSDLGSLRGCTVVAKLFRAVLLLELGRIHLWQDWDLVQPLDQTESVKFRDVQQYVLQKELHCALSKMGFSTGFTGSGLKQILRTSTW